MAAAVARSTYSEYRATRAPAGPSSIICTFCPSESLTSLLVVSKHFRVVAQGEFNTRSARLFQRFFSSQFRFEWSDYFPYLPSRALCTRSRSPQDDIHEIDRQVIGEMRAMKTSELLIHRFSPFNLGGRTPLFSCGQAERPALLILRVHSHVELTTQSPILNMLEESINQEEREYKDKKLMSENIVGLLVTPEAGYSIVESVTGQYFAKPWN